ncbi:MAG: hypothetical protein ACXWFI_04310 [Methylobacter sp.]
MIIDWMAGKAQLFLPEQDDEFYLGLDFALSPEIMNLLHAQNSDSLAAEQEGAQQQAFAEPVQQETEDADTFIAQLELDEHELALA